MRTLSATPEGRIKTKLTARLRETFGPKVYRFMPVQNGMGAPGLDYFLCVNGRFVAIETKVPGKNLTPRQETTKAQIEAANGLVFEVRTDADIARVVEHFAWIIRGYPPQTKP